eukprot:Skav211133  [mRNA]  locus=scaffold1447:104854:106928:- [translate_table: standard]
MRRSANSAFRQLFAGGAWLPSTAAANVGREFFQHLRAYKRLAEVGNFNWIGKLHELYQKKLLGLDRNTRNIQKDEIRFNTERRPGDGHHQSLFQSTVDAQEFEGGPFLGDTCSTKKLAEHSAARIAIENEFPHWLTDDAHGTTEPKRRKNRKKRLSPKKEKEPTEESQSASSDSESVASNE